MQREAESLIDMPARRAGRRAPGAGAESLGREVDGWRPARPETFENNSRRDETGATKKSNADCASFEQTEATVTPRTKFRALDALRAEVTGAIAAAKDAAVERAVAARSALWLRRRRAERRADEQSCWSSPTPR